MTAEELIAFENEVKVAFEAGKIRGPVHLSGNNEAELIDIFKSVDPTDWVLCSYRSHYHALLHGIPRELVMAEIMAGRSMNLSFPRFRFFSSAIVGGHLSMAVGVAAALKRQEIDRSVWCFCGDMAARGGAFHEAMQYAVGHDLRIKFYVEDNGLSCDTPTGEVWGYGGRQNIVHYSYERKYPHVGSGTYINFV